MPSCFTDVFTIETWEQAKSRGWKVTGFPPPTPTKGGYFETTFEIVKEGDIPCFYVKAPAKRWVGKTFARHMQARGSSHAASVLGCDLSREALECLRLDVPFQWLDRRKRKRRAALPR